MGMRCPLARRDSTLLITTQHPYYTAQIVFLIYFLVNHWFDFAETSKRNRFESLLAPDRVSAESNQAKRRNERETRSNGRSAVDNWPDWETQISRAHSPRPASNVLVWSSVVMFNPRGLVENARTNQIRAHYRDRLKPFFNPSRVNLSMLWVWPMEMASRDISMQNQFPSYDFTNGISK